MNRMRRRVPVNLGPTPEPPPAGIYEMPGTMHGCRSLVAYDREGEFTLACGEPAYASLRHWLELRGVILPESAPLALLELPA